MPEAVLKEFHYYISFYNRLLDAKKAEPGLRIPRTLLQCIKFCRRKFPHQKLNFLSHSGFKSRKWIRKTITRSDGMQFDKWERETDDFKKELRCRLWNVDVYALLMFNNIEYQSFLEEIDWTMDETRYLMQMYRKYNVL